jgi:hypothetical protein
LFDFQELKVVYKETNKQVIRESFDAHYFLIRMLEKGFYMRLQEFALKT